MAYLKKTKRSKRKMRKTMRIRGGMFSTESAPAVPEPVAGPVAGAESVAESVAETVAEPAAVPDAQAVVEPGVTKEQAIECAKKVVMFLEKLP